MYALYVRNVQSAVSFNWPTPPYHFKTAHGHIFYQIAVFTYGTGIYARELQKKSVLPTHFF